MKKIIGVTGVACILAMASIAGASSFQNGGFETTTGADPGASFIPLHVGNTNLTGWTVIKGVNAGVSENGGIDYIGTLWPASELTHSLDLDDSSGVGGVAQTFDTTPGTTYLVTFDMAGNPAGPPALKWMRVSATGGSLSADYSFDTTGKSLSSMGWLQMSYSFTADASGSTTLSFQSLSPSGNAYGPALDNVVVTAGTGGPPVPEPVTLFSAFMAVSGLGMYIRKRMKVQT